MEFMPRGLDVAMTSADDRFAAIAQRPGQSYSGLIAWAEGSNVRVGLRTVEAEPFPTGNPLEVTARLHALYWTDPRGASGMATDPGAEQTVQRVSIAWGDGSSWDVLDLPIADGNVLHTYPAAGAYTITYYVEFLPSTAVLAPSGVVEWNAPVEVGAPPEEPVDTTPPDSSPPASEPQSL